MLIRKIKINLSFWWAHKYSLLCRIVIDVLSIALWIGCTTKVNNKLLLTQEGADGKWNLYYKSMTCGTGCFIHNTLSVYTHRNLVRLHFTHKSSQDNLQPTYFPPHTRTRLLCFINQSTVIALRQLQVFGSPERLLCVEALHLSTNLCSPTIHQGNII